MSKCFIVTSYLEGSLMGLLDHQPGDGLICVDAGYKMLEGSPLTPDLIIGDFDSVEFPSAVGLKLIHLPMEKDDTDTLAALKKALEFGFKDIVILGGLGGRLDHTIANLQCLSFGLGAEAHIEIRDESNRAFLIEPSLIHIKEESDFYLSLFAYSETCQGITTTGLQYPLVNATLTSSYPLGISNRFTEKEATISFTSGKLLIILSKDRS